MTDNKKHREKALKGVSALLLAIFLAFQLCGPSVPAALADELASPIKALFGSLMKDTLVYDDVYGVVHGEYAIMSNELQAEATLSATTDTTVGSRIQSGVNYLVQTGQNLVQTGQGTVGGTTESFDLVRTDGTCIMSFSVDDIPDSVADTTRKKAGLVSSAQSVLMRFLNNGSTLYSAPKIVDDKLAYELKSYDGSFVSERTYKAVKPSNAGNIAAFSDDEDSTTIDIYKKNGDCYGITLPVDNDMTSIWYSTTTVEEDGGKAIITYFVSGFGANSTQIKTTWTWTEGASNFVLKDREVKDGTSTGSVNNANYFPMDENLRDRVVTYQGISAENKYTFCVYRLTDSSTAQEQSYRISTISGTFDVTIPHVFPGTRFKLNPLNIIQCGYWDGDEYITREWMLDGSEVPLCPYSGYLVDKSLSNSDVYQYYIGRKPDTNGGSDKTYLIDATGKTQAILDDTYDVCASYKDAAFLYKIIDDHTFTIYDVLSNANRGTFHSDTAVDYIRFHTTSVSSIYTLATESTDLVNNRIVSNMFGYYDAGNRQLVRSASKAAQYGALWYTGLSTNDTQIYMVSDNSNDDTPYALVDRNLVPVTVAGYELKKPKSWDLYSNKTVRTLPDGTTVYYAMDKSGKYGVIDAAGNIYAPFEFDSYYDCGDPAVSITLLEKDGAWIFYDLSNGGAVSMPSNKIPTTASSVLAGEVQVGGATDALPDVLKNAAFEIKNAAELDTTAIKGTFDLGDGGTVRGVYDMRFIDSDSKAEIPWSDKSSPIELTVRIKLDGETARLCTTHDLTMHYVEYTLTGDASGYSIQAAKKAMDTSVSEDGYLTFKTNHFSTYALTATLKKAVTDDDGNEKKQTESDNGFHSVSYPDNSTNGTQNTGAYSVNTPATTSTTGQSTSGSSSNLVKTGDTATWVMAVLGILTLCCMVVFFLRRKHRQEPSKTEK